MLTLLSSQTALAEKTISLVASDMDGTLTRYGKFTSVLLKALEELSAANIAVLIVTGRSAGWVQGLKSYLPVMGAIAENGGVYFSRDREQPELLTSIPDLIVHRQQLGKMFAKLKREFPQIRESTDNCFRLTDWTFDVQGLNSLELQQLGTLCVEEGWGFTYSTVQCHIKPQNQTKAISLLQVLKNHFSELNRDEIITVGDSPNDESLFDRVIFPLSVGVANILHYTDQLKHLPTYITSLEEGEGFNELAQFLLKNNSEVSIHDR
ncbi:MAG TPA: HAD family hydrolase [Leptolyngbyaceae cyanobacterium]